MLCVWLPYQWGGPTQFQFFHDNVTYILQPEIPDYTVPYIVHIFIKDFTKRAHPLVYLTRKDAPFEFRPQQISAQEDLKRALIQSPALRPIDYNSDALVIFAVCTSFIAVCYYLTQCDVDNPKIWYYS